MKRLTPILFIASMLGCAAAEEPPPVMETTPPDPVVTEKTDEPEPEPEVEPEETGRRVTRMTIEQLARSIPVVTGGIEWIEDFGQGPINMLEVLAPTLGAPDYALVTDENMEPSLIIAKFMQDAAARICVKWVAQDVNMPPADRTLVGHADWASLDEALVKANLRRLQLRFFTRHVDPTDDEPISDLYDLFLAASTSAPAAEAAANDGWLAVCMALMTDPEFVIY